MSLVNDVLENLQRQPGGFHRHAQRELAGLRPPERRSKRVPVLEIGLALLAIAAVALAAILVVAEEWPDVSFAPDTAATLPFVDVASPPASVDARPPAASLAAEPPRAPVDARPPVAKAADRPPPVPGEAQLPLAPMADNPLPPGPAAAVEPLTGGDRADTLSRRPSRQLGAPPTPLVRIETTQSPRVQREIRAERLYHKGVEQAGQNRLGAARRSFEDTLSLTPEHRGAREQLAVTLIRLGRLEAARARLEEGLERDAHYTPFLVLQARALLEAEQVEGAVALLESADPRHRRDPEYGTMLGALYQRQGRATDAAAVYRQVLRDDPNNARCWMGLGLALDAEGHGREALLAYRSAQRLGGAEPESRHWLATRIRTLEKIPR